MKNCLFIILLFSVVNGHAQIKNVVKWDYQIDKISDKEYAAVLTAKIDAGGHLYSKDLPHDSGIPTSMKITSDHVEPIGEVQEIGNKIKKFSEAFGVQIVYFSDSVK